jgi:hypothetical protein
LEGFSQSISVFIGAGQNVIFYFLHNAAAKKLINLWGHIEKLFDFYELQKNYSSRDTIPLSDYKFTYASSPLRFATPCLQDKILLNFIVQQNIKRFRHRD